MRAAADRRPLVGVTASRRGGRWMWWFNRIVLRLQGARPLRLRPGDPVEVASLDGLVVGGGDDIDATLYGGTLAPGVRVDRERDAFELALLRPAVAEGVPVLGICRGAQMISVFRGGRLHGSIAAVFREAPRMHTPLPRKQVEIVRDSLLFRLLRRERVRVNALHHQSIDVPGVGLRIVARDTYGIVQAIETTGPEFLLGVQWHPEFMILHASQRKLFAALVAAARKRASARSTAAAEPRYQGSSSPS